MLQLSCLAAAVGHVFCWQFLYRFGCNRSSRSRVRLGPTNDDTARDYVETDHYPNLDYCRTHVKMVSCSDRHETFHCFIVLGSRHDLRKHIQIIVHTHSLVLCNVVVARRIRAGLLDRII
ncbi:hypothetical protein BJ166DRAFT_53363 [Pestalotiopsis sp. NC0098]|nr:hypothetical protein BJ166DRAFT_53363 [Pestalotiopsis sp. NC0098]